MAVILYHAFPTLFPGGYIGVDIFFVLSGFLITGIIVNDLNRNKFSFSAFYQRRIRRIFPPLAIILIAVMFLGWFILLPTPFTQLGIHTRSAAIFLSNIQFWQESGYFDVASEQKQLLHIWSLSIEEQFYILWPLTLVLISRFKRFAFLWTVAFLIGSFSLNVYYSAKDVTSAFYLPFCRFWELLIGAVLSQTYSKVEPFFTTNSFTKNDFHRKIAINTLSIISALLILFPIFALSKYSTFPGWWALVPTTGTAVLILVIDKSFLYPLFRSKVMVFIGLISYSLYLWHWPLFSFARQIYQEHITTTHYFFVIAICFLISWIMFVFVETPIRRSKKISISAGLVLGMLTVCFLGVTIQLNKGFDFRLNNEVYEPKWTYSPQEVNYANHPLAVKLYGSDIDSKRDIFLESNGFNSNQRVSIIGDSHAHRVFYALKENNNWKQSISIYAKGACLPFYKVDILKNGKTLKCQPTEKRILEYLEREKDIKMIVLNAFYEQYFENEIAFKTDDNIVTYALDEKLHLIEKSLNELVKKMAKSDKKIVLLLDVPSYNSSIISCVHNPLNLVSINRSCLKPLQQHLDSNQHLREIFENVRKQNPHVLIVDPVKAFCDTISCRAFLDKVPLYLDDGHHLSDEGMKILGEYIAPKIMNYLKS